MLNDRIQELCAELRKACENLPANEIQPATSVELAKTIEVIYTAAARHPDWRDYMSAEYGNLSGELFGFLLMQYLPCSGTPMTRESKIFWLDVAEEIGPDWVAEIYRVSQFLKRVEGFV